MGLVKKKFRTNKKSDIAAALYVFTTIKSYCELLRYKGETE